MITGSESAQAAASQDGETTFDASQLPVVDPDDLAEYYWDLYTERDRVEQTHPASLDPRTGTA
ncbi:hypothetical protein ABZZ74_15830 [Streptomyces sp. NPDC006476]|uniref:hypothetical protein n=1 Tax=Streptomyces sp. NPDC006476 TaxID=3157175 RepID=UPI0033AC0C32